MKLEKTALVSFPRSGRHLIHALFAKGYGLPGDHIDRARPDANEFPFVVSHDISTTQDVDGRRCIVMIRCPFAALLSFMKLMHPGEVTKEKFEWALFNPGNPTTTNQCGWIEYWKRFAEHHVLSSPYPNPRIIVGYQNFIQNPRRWLKVMTTFAGGHFDLDRALHQECIGLRNHCWRHPFYQDEDLVARMSRALEPQLSQVRSLKII